MASFEDIAAEDVFHVQQRALVRMLLFVTGRTHEMLAEAGGEMRAAVLRAAVDDGQLDGIGMYRAQRGIEEAWGRFFAEWSDLFERLRREAAMAPFGTMAVMHEAWVLPAAREMEEAESTLDFVFNPQLQEVLDAADQRVYDDGLQLSGRLWNLDQKSLNGLKRKLYEGVATGASAWDIAKAVEGYLGAGADCPRWTRTRLRLTKKEIASGDTRGLKRGEECKGQGVSYNALRLARNELQVIHALATDAIMARMPWIEQEQINLSPAHPEADICDDVVGGGERGEGIYEKGTILLPLHVQCLCFKTAVLMKPDEFADRLRGWMNGSETWAAMDAYQDAMGGNILASMAGTLAAAALVRWALEGWDEFLRVVSA